MLTSPPAVSRSPAYLSPLEYATLTPGEQAEILYLQQAILELVARGTPALDVAIQVCKLEEQLLPNSVGSVMLLDESDTFLNVFCAPSVPPEGIARLNGLRPGPGGGSCGNAVFRGEPQFVHNTFIDDRWCNLRPLAYDFNLRSCWSNPIIDKRGKVIGSFALSSFEHRTPSNFHRLLLQIGASIIGIVLDRSKDEETLRLFQTAYQGSEEGVMITDLDKRILTVNPAFTRMLGYTAAEIAGQTPAKLASGQHDASFYADMWACIHAQGSWRGEIWNRRKNGEVFPEWLSISAVKTPQGEVTHYIGNFSDLSERKRAEQMIREKESAQAANIAKSAFLANMSHEIRTPLNAITGLVHLIQRAGVSADQAERLQRIQAAGQHLLQIINDILDLSKIEAGKLSLENLPINIGALLANACSILQERANAKHIELHIDSPAQNHALMGDPTRLQQALLNYATNAIKFTDQGRVTLRARITEEADRSALIRFEVEDTGIGIPAAQQAMLFEAFEQGHTTITRRYGGTGLGLAITRNLARLMGGDAGFSSSTEKGSTFWFTVKLAQSDESVGLPVSQPHTQADALLLARHAGRQILLVEDEPINRDIAQAMLTAVGLHVDLAENGLDACEKAAATGYDLILMDMQMPELDGLEATRRIRQQAANTAVPILAMTANAFAEDRANCLEAGMDDFIPKPFAPEDLFSALLKHLDRTHPLN